MKRLIKSSAGLFKIGSTWALNADKYGVTKKLADIYDASPILQILFSRLCFPQERVHAQFAADCWFVILPLEISKRQMTQRNLLLSYLHNSIHDVIWEHGICFLLCVCGF